MLLHQRDVGGVILLYKAYVGGAKQLDLMKQLPQTPNYTTRVAKASVGATVVVPCSRFLMHSKDVLYYI